MKCFSKFGVKSGHNLSSIQHLEPITVCVQDHSPQHQSWTSVILLQLNTVKAEKVATATEAN